MIAVSRRCAVNGYAEESVKEILLQTAFEGAAVRMVTLGAEVISDAFGRQAVRALSCYRHVGIYLPEGRQLPDSLAQVSWSAVKLSLVGHDKRAEPEREGNPRGVDTY